MSTAQDRTYGWIKELIAGFAQDEGVFLTEAEVAGATGVSRTPVREAMLRLEAEGLLQIVPKKGAYVPPLSDGQVVATMEARSLVERWAAQIAAADGPPAGLAELLAEQSRLLAEGAEPAAFIEADRQFHSAIVWAAGNPVLAEFYESLRDRQIRLGLRALRSGPERGQAVLAEHAAIFDALAAGDPGRLGRAVEAHLSSTLTAFRRRAR